MQLAFEIHARGPLRSFQRRADNPGGLSGAKTRRAGLETPASRGAWLLSTRDNNRFLGVVTLEVVVFALGSNFGTTACLTSVFFCLV